MYISYILKLSLYEEKTDFFHSLFVKFCSFTKKNVYSQTNRDLTFVVITFFEGHIFVSSLYCRLFQCSILNRSSVLLGLANCITPSHLHGDVDHTGVQQHAFS